MVVYFYPCLVATIICFMLLPFLHISATEGNDVGFSVNLIRKNSSHHGHVLPALRRLMEMELSAMEKTVSPQSPIYAYLGHYLMEVSIGTPPFKIYGIADTCSDLTWTSCVPCNKCYKQLC